MLFSTDYPSTSPAQPSPAQPSPAQPSPAQPSAAAVRQFFDAIPADRSKVPSGNAEALFRLT